VFESLFMLRGRCDEGYGEDTCVPVAPLTSELKSNFSLVTQLESDWLEITGGQLAASQHGCGTIVSGESLYFHKVHVFVVVCWYFVPVMAQKTKII